MFVVHFLLLFLGVAHARPVRLRQQRMETADGTRQQRLTDNRTLIKLSIFMMNTDTHHNSMNLKRLFTVFSIFNAPFIF
jgi:hypothetical protein